MGDLSSFVTDETVTIYNVTMPLSTRYEFVLRVNILPPARMAFLYNFSASLTTAGCSANGRKLSFWNDPWIKRPLVTDIKGWNIASERSRIFTIFLSTEAQKLARLWVASELLFLYIANEALYMAVPDFNYGVILTYFFQHFRWKTFIYICYSFYRRGGKQKGEKIICHWAINRLYWVYFSFCRRYLSDCKKD